MFLHYVNNVDKLTAAPSQERSCASLFITVKVPMGVDDPTRRACNINPSNGLADWLFSDTEKEET